MSGKRFGSVVAIKRVENEHGTSTKQTKWLCVCDCGNEFITTGAALRSGNTKSCGCYRNTHLVTHGESKTRLYRIWRRIKTTCASSNYTYYGARGITVCDEWTHSFESFRDWSMANGYRDDLTIDRIDSNGNYEPSNCRWATMKEQSNNTRRNIVIEHKGEEHTLAQWSEILCINYITLYKRIITRHWSTEQAFSVPTRNKEVNINA
jgi:hypothetical protein